jgi:hypothetical protein
MLTTVAVSPWAAGAGVLLLGMALWLAIDWARRRWLAKRGATGRS